MITTQINITTQWQNTLHNYNAVQCSIYHSNLSISPLLYSTLHTYITTTIQTPVTKYIHIYFWYLLASIPSLLPHHTYIHTVRYDPIHRTTVYQYLHATSLLSTAVHAHKVHTLLTLFLYTTQYIYIVLLCFHAHSSSASTPEDERACLGLPMGKPHRLSKPPPPPSRAAISLSSHLSSAFNSVKARRSSGALHRTPSAPALAGPSPPTTARSADSHDRFQSPSQRRQPSQVSTSIIENGATVKGTSPLLQQQGYYYTSPLAELPPIKFAAQDQQHLSLGHLTPQDPTLGPKPATPFVMESKNSARNTLRRPPPSPLHYSSPLEKSSSKSTGSGTSLLRQSMSFSTSDKSLPGNMSPGRAPDEHNMLKSSNSVRKKTGFSNFVNNMLGSPRRVEISSPSNPVHVTHVGFNFVTGEFTVSCTSVDLMGAGLMTLD